MIILSFAKHLSDEQHTIVCLNILNMQETSLVDFLRNEWMKALPDSKGLIKTLQHSVSYLRAFFKLTLNSKAFASEF